MEALVKQGLHFYLRQLKMTTIPTQLKYIKGKKMDDDAGKNILFGALWLVGGFIVTAATYEMARNGGSYVLAWGAMLGGGLQLLCGIIQAAKS